mgnify:CR=1 FL=1
MCTRKKFARKCRRLYYPWVCVHAPFFVAVAGCKTCRRHPHLAHVMKLRPPTTATRKCSSAIWHEVEQL